MIIQILIENMILSLIAFSTFNYLFVMCECGERVSAAFGEYEDLLMQCDWHLLPHDIHRLYLTFIVDVQQPINFHCYGGILCTRDIFKKVIVSHVEFDTDHISFNFKSFIFILCFVLDN